MNGGTMSFFEIFTLFASGITIFGVTVGVFSSYNGRMTRREIGGLIAKTEELVVQGAERTQELIREGRQETQQLIRESRQETQQLIREIHQETQQLIRDSHRETQELIRGTHQGTQQLIREGQDLIRETRELIAREAEANRQVLQGITAILGRIDERVR